MTDTFMRNSIGFVSRMGFRAEMGASAGPKLPSVSILLQNSGSFFYFKGGSSSHTLERQWTIRNYMRSQMERKILKKHFPWEMNSCIFFAQNFFQSLSTFLTDLSKCVDRNKETCIPVSEHGGMQGILSPSAVPHQVHSSYFRVSRCSILSYNNSHSICVLNKARNWIPGISQHMLLHDVAQQELEIHVDC